MRPFCVIAGVLAISLGISGKSAAGDGTSKFAGADYGQTAGQITRKLGVTRWLGTPEYRCGHYTTVCRYVRPVHRSYSWSVSHRYRAAPPLITRRQVRLGRYRLEPPIPVEAGSGRASYLPEAHAPGRVNRSGGFVRVEAPGKATRWVRSKNSESEK
ncbi:MAG: hypothetical protein MI861_16480 [Pirellulales bacterium]|nr:hypothetical protein [Pirellulales bacterium]